MKHLKPFNESNNNWSNIKVSDVLDFTNNSHLVYLLDEGYIIDVRRPGGTLDEEEQLDDYSYIRIICMDSITCRSISKPWDDIKDYFIPSLKRFVNEFNLSDEIEIEMGLRYTSEDWQPVTPKLFTLDEVFNDKVKLGSRGVTEVNWIKIRFKRFY